MSRTQGEILELSRQNGLHVRWLNGCDELATEHLLLEGSPVCVILIGQIIDPTLFANGFTQADKSRNAEEPG